MEVSNIEIKVCDNGDIAYTKNICCEKDFLKSLPLDNDLVNKYGYDYILSNIWDKTSIEKGWFRLIPMGWSRTPSIINAKPNKKGAFYGMIIKKQ